MFGNIKLWSEVLTIINGKNQKKVENKDGKYPIYGSGGIMGYADDYICLPNTTIIGRKGSINNPIYVDEHFWNVDTAFGLAPKKDLNGKYLYYFCKQYNFLKHNKATTLPSLTKTDLLRIKIPLPPLNTQIYIASILNDATALRDKTAQLLREYDLLAQSIFLDMFGDPTIGSVNVLDSSIAVLGGYAFKSVDFVDEGIPVIKIGTVNKGYFDLKSFSYLPENELEKYKKWIVRPNDLLISLTGTVGKDDYGNIEIATNKFSHYLLNQRVAKIEVKDNYNSIFLYYMFLQRQVKQLLTKVSRGVRQANISNQDILNLKLIQPNMTLQNQFAEKIALIEQQKELAKQELKESEDLFNCLLQKAFKGELIQEEVNA